jgi:aminoglycoside phosphotransferase (APT) family kinase protein
LFRREGETILGVVQMTIDRVLTAAFESGDFEPLAELYAADALLDWSMPGGRARVVGPEAIVRQLRAWWPGSGVFTNWDVWTFPSGLTIDFERRAGGARQRQRQFLQVRDGRIARHQAYCARPQGGEPEELLDDAPVAAARRLDVIARREPLLHAGQSGTSLERIVLADGRRLVVKRLSGDDWVARVTHDGGREASLWTEGVLARMPHEIDHAVLAAGREGRGTWLLMRDVSDELLRPDRRLTREESRRLLATFAAMHRRFAGEEIDGACSLEDRIVLAAPATVAGEVDGVDYLPKILAVGWDVFAETVPADVATAVLGAVENPEPLARELARCASTLLHNDLRGANLGLLSDRVIVLDWGLAGTGPCELDFAWYLFVNGWRIDATREQLVDDFRHAAADLYDPGALALAWLAQLCWHGPLLAHELVEASDEKRERARDELSWWIARVREAL